MHRESQLRDGACVRADSAAQSAQVAVTVCTLSLDVEFAGTVVEVSSLCLEEVQQRCATISQSAIGLHSLF